MMDMITDAVVRRKCMTHWAGSASMAPTTCCALANEALVEALVGGLALTAPAGPGTGEWRRCRASRGETELSRVIIPREDEHEPARQDLSGDDAAGAVRVDCCAAGRSAAALAELSTRKGWPRM
jgi:hypothetical protein